MINDLQIYQIDEPHWDGIFAEMDKVWAGFEMSKEDLLTSKEVFIPDIILYNGDGDYYCGTTKQHIRSMIEDSTKNWVVGVTKDA